MLHRRVLAAILVFVLCFSSPQAVLSQSGGPMYIVQEGDTLYSIAIRFGTTVDDILSLNPQVEPSLLYPGMQIIIPGFEGVEGALVTTSVLAGQTLEVLEKVYASPREDIIRLNRILNPERLYIGQDLVLAEGEQTSSLQAFIFPVSETLLNTAAQQALNPWVLASYLDTPHLWVTPGKIGHIPAEESSLYPDPISNIMVNPTAVYQGRTLEVQVHASTGIRVSGALGDKVLTFVEYEEGGYIALQGIDAMAEPGLETLRVQLFTKDDGIPFYGFQQPIRIRNAGYGSDPVLTVPPESVDPVTTQAEADAVAEAVEAVSTEKRWGVVFAFPSPYTEAFPAVFGSRRNYNDLGYNSYHTGLDLFGNRDTQVTAPADGTVVMVDTLPARGQAIYIDHGWGVYSGYGHLSQVFVAEGEEVTTGQVIAMVGSTGRVTGPHLHWEIVVGGIPVDPLEWVERVFPAGD
ncbi:MAG: peptidoglycan DD-metalloendopeptidase family protein [Anaerolineales bacterium]|nr:peptidoglycan DD-metalloendopeptidase family protein [Anaerolineales bacterium]